MCAIFQEEYPRQFRYHQGHHSHCSRHKDRSQSCCHLSVTGWAHWLQRHMGGVTPLRHGDDNPLSDSEGQGTKVWRELFQSLQSDTDWHNMFWACPGQSPHLSSLVLPFRMRLPILCSSTIVSWKHVTHLVSQLHSRRGILPYDESYLKVRPYLI